MTLKLFSCLYYFQCVGHLAICNCSNRLDYECSSQDPFYSTLYLIYILNTYCYFFGYTEHGNRGLE